MPSLAALIGNVGEGLEGGLDRGEERQLRYRSVIAGGQA